MEKDRDLTRVFSATLAPEARAWLRRSSSNSERTYQARKRKKLGLSGLHRKRHDAVRTTFQALLSGDRATKSVS